MTLIIFAEAFVAILVQKSIAGIGYIVEEKSKIIPPSKDGGF